MSADRPGGRASPQPRGGDDASRAPLPADGVGPAEEEAPAVRPPGVVARAAGRVGGTVPVVDGRRAAYPPEKEPVGNGPPSGGVEDRVEPCTWPGPRAAARLGGEARGQAPAAGASGSGARGARVGTEAPRRFARSVNGKLDVAPAGAATPKRERLRAGPCRPTVDLRPSSPGTGRGRSAPARGRVRPRRCRKPPGGLARSA